MVWDRGVVGCHSQKIHEKLIQKGSKLALEKAINITRTQVMSNQQLYGARCNMLLHSEHSKALESNKNSRNLKLSWNHILVMWSFFKFWRSTGICLCHWLEKLCQLNNLQHQWFNFKTWCNYQFPDKQQKFRTNTAFIEVQKISAGHCVFHAWNNPSLNWTRPLNETKIK